MIQNFIQALPESFGDRFTYYTKGGMKYFFKRENAERFHIMVGPAMRASIERIIKENKSVLVRVNAR